MHEWIGRLARSIKPAARNTAQTSTLVLHGLTRFAARIFDFHHGGMIFVVFCVRENDLAVLSNKFAPHRYDFTLISMPKHYHLISKIAQMHYIRSLIGIKPSGNPATLFQLITYRSVRNRISIYEALLVLLLLLPGDHQAKHALDIDPSYLL
jgi:hypothetical protein